MNLTLLSGFRQAHQELVSAATDYKTDVTTVDQYSISVAMLSNPILNHPEVIDYEAFITELTTAKSKAMYFSDSILANMEELPGQILGYNGIFSDAIAEALTDVNTLKTNPQNQTAKSDLVDTLTILSKKLGVFLSEVTDLYNRLSTYSTDLPVQAAELTELANTAAAGQNVDTAKLAVLNTDIQNLRDEISSLTAAIIALSITDGIALTLGAIAVIAAGPIGMVTWIFLGAAIAAATTFIAIDATKIKDDQDKITSDLTDTDAYTTDAATLQTCADTYTELSKSAVSVQENMKRIMDAWNEIISDINDTIGHIQNAESEIDQSVWTDIETELDSALSEWTELMADLTPLNVTISGNTAQLKVGMNSNDVGTAVQNATTMDFTDYLNSVA